MKGANIGATRGACVCGTLARVHAVRNAAATDASAMTYNERERERVRESAKPDRWFGWERENKKKEIEVDLVLLTPQCK